MWIAIPDLQADGGMEAAYQALVAAVPVDTAAPIRRSWWCRSCFVGWASERREPCWSCDSLDAVDAGAPRLVA